MGKEDINKMYLGKDYSKLVNVIFSKKYSWFKKIEVDNVIYNKLQYKPSFLNLKGTIYVDSDWGHKQFREYYYDLAFPEDTELSFGDIMGGDLSREIQDDFKMIFSSLYGTQIPTYMSFTWLMVKFVDEDKRLEESILRIIREEINGSSLSPYIKRRIDLSDEKIKKVLKTKILTDKDIKVDDEFRLNKIIDNTTGELLNWVNQEEYDDNYDSVYQYIKNNYSDFILQYFREIFKDDEEAKFCFIKHSERYGGRGFTDCFGSWFSFLNGYGSWLPNVDWNKVKEELKTKDRILLARPLEGHIYEYYFSVLKK